MKPTLSLTKVITHCHSMNIALPRGMISFKKHPKQPISCWIFGEMLVWNLRLEFRWFQQMKRVHLEYHQIRNHSASSWLIASSHCWNAAARGSVDAESIQCTFSIGTWNFKLCFHYHSCLPGRIISKWKWNRKKNFL